MAFIHVRLEDSSVIDLVVYDTKHSALAIKFKTGSTWAYLDVPIEVYDELTSAKSAGNYFNNHIRNYYIAEKMQSLTVDMEVLTDEI
jgi:hypothetical protein